MHRWVEKGMKQWRTSGSFHEVFPNLEGWEIMQFVAYASENLSWEKGVSEGTG